MGWVDPDLTNRVTSQTTGRTILNFRFFFGFYLPRGTTGCRQTRRHFESRTFFWAQGALWARIPGATTIPAPWDRIKFGAFEKYQKRVNYCVNLCVGLPYT